MVEERQRDMEINRNPGKRVYTTTVAPLLSKNAMAYAIFLRNQGKRVYTIGPERRVYTIETSDPEKQKGGFPRWWRIFLLP